MTTKVRKPTFSRQNLRPLSQKGRLSILSCYIRSRKSRLRLGTLFEWLDCWKSHHGIGSFRDIRWRADYPHNRRPAA